MWSKGNKFGAKKTSVAGHWFDSKLEGAVFQLLKLEEAGGGIRDIVHHPGSVHLSAAKIIYQPDFRFIDCKTQESHYAESKGFETTDWKIKLKLWRAYGPAPLRLYKGTHRNVVLVETVVPRGENA